MKALPLVLCLAASLASAQDLTPTDQLRVQLHEYYRGERLSGFVPFVGSGVGSVVAGTLLLTSNTTLGRGAGWTHLSFGVLEIVAGLYFAFSSYGKERSLDAALTANPAEFVRLRIA